MTVSATLAWLNLSMYHLDKSFHSTGMPKVTIGYGTKTVNVSY